MSKKWHTCQSQRNWLTLTIKKILTSIDHISIEFWHWQHFWHCFLGVMTLTLKSWKILNFDLHWQVWHVIFAVILLSMSINVRGFRLSNINVTRLTKNVELNVNVSLIPNDLFRFLMKSHSSAWISYSKNSMKKLMMNQLLTLNLVQLTKPVSKLTFKKVRQSWITWKALWKRLEIRITRTNDFKNR